MYRAKKAWENQQNDTENRKNAIILRNISEKRLQINNKFVSLQRESKINSKIRNYKRYIIDKMSNLIKPEGYKALLDMRQTEMGKFFPDKAKVQTHDLQNRNLTLYSTKLRDQKWWFVGKHRLPFRSNWLQKYVFYFE